MMHKAMKSYLLIVGLLSLFGCGIDAAILTVTSLDDALGSAVTLRQAILDASGGDIINFSVSGTITLDEALGKLVVDKELTIDGLGQNITVDGANLINICFHITNAGTADASNSIIRNLTIQNFNGHDVDPGSGTASQELPAYGILIDGGAINCSCELVTINNIHSGIDEEAGGIRTLEDVTTLMSNTVTNISSESNLAGDSGGVFGISAGNVVAIFTNNMVFNLTSGDASGESGAVFGLQVGNVGSNINNTASNLTSGRASGDSGNVSGVSVGTVAGSNSNNAVSSLASGSAGGNSGAIIGMSLGTISGACTLNTLSAFVTGNADGNSGNIVGMQFGSAQSCVTNTISNFTSGNADDTSGSVLGIVADLINLTCSFSVLQYLSMGESPNSNELFGAIRIVSVGNGGRIECNTVSQVTGNADYAFGIEVDGGDSLSIKANTINGIENSGGPAHGLLLGGEAGTVGLTFVTNSLIFCNNISAILGSNASGFGITVSGSGSVGNDILNNSIFDINGTAISILTLVDANIVLQSIFCFDGCKLTVKGLVVSMIAGTEIEEFRVQFFVSDSHNPSQAKAFIGEKTVEAGSFTAKIVPAVPVDYGQFITATATAIPLGSDEENNNTSEVSNALLSCKPTSNFCPCPEMVPDETCTDACVPGL